MKKDVHDQKLNIVTPFFCLFPPLIAISQQSNLRLSAYMILHQTLNVGRILYVMCGGRTIAEQISAGTVSAYFKKKLFDGALADVVSIGFYPWFSSGVVTPSCGNGYTVFR